MESTSPLECSCDNCTEHRKRGGLLIELFDAATVAARAQQLSARIVENQRSIANVECLNGDTLYIRRWNKLPATDSTKALHTAYQETFGAQHSMPTVPRPDFEAISRWAGLSKKEKKEQERVFAIPYLNTANFNSDKEILLSFLYTRSTNPASEFALLDLVNANVCVDCHDDGPDSALESQVMVFGRPNAEYGLLIQRDDLEIGEAEYQPCVGLMILIIQDQIYSFLKNAARTLLSQCPVPEPGVVFPTKPARSLDIEWPSMSMLALRTTYEHWGAIELRYLLTMVGGHRTKALCHLLNLRESPEYLKTTLLEWGQHVLTPAHRSDHGGVTESDKWAYISTLMIQEAFYLADKWDGIADLLLKLTEALEMYQSAWDAFEGAEVGSDESASILKERTDEKFDLLEALQSMLEGTQAFIIDRCLAVGVPGSPALRNTLNSTELDKADPFKFHISDVTSRKSTSKNKRSVLSLFKILCTPADRHLYGPRNVSIEIQRLLDSDEGGFKNNVSSWIQNQFAEVALIIEITSQLFLHPDLQYGYDENGNDNDDAENGDESESEDDLEGDNNGDGAASQDGPSYIRLIDEYCVAKTMDSHGVDLDWEGLDHKLGLREGTKLYENGGEMPSIFQDLMSSKHIISHPSEARPSAPAESGTCNVGHAMKQTSLSIAISVADTGKKWPVPKTKTKTRSDARVAEQVIEAHPQQAAELSPTPQIPLRKRDYDTADDLLGESRAGNVSWADFRHFMVAAGCSVVPTFGSGWIFGRDGLGAVHFHDPHVAKIPHGKLMAMAGDLRTAFKWRLESFTLQ